MHPGQIVPILADRGPYNSYGEACGYGSERSFYRVLHANGPGPSPWPCQAAPGATSGAAAGGQRAQQLWSWDITYLPTSVRGVWLYLYLMVDVWSRKVVAWEVAEREEAQIAADLVSRACLRERISKRRPNPLILHAGNGNAMRAATLESRLGAGCAQVFLQAEGQQ